MAWIITDKRTGKKHLQVRIKNAEGKWSTRSKCLGHISHAEAKIALKRFETDANYLKLSFRTEVKVTQTLRKACDRYLESLKGLIGEYTLEKRKELLDRFCNLSKNDPAAKVFFQAPKATVGELLLDQLHPESLQKFYTLKKYKPNSVRLLLASLKGVYQLAVQNYEINENPILKVKRPKIEKLPPRYVDPQLIEDILGVMKGRPKDFYTILAYTGMRPGEALRLQARDITKNGITVRHTKTKQFRSLPIHRTLVPVLARLTKGKKGEDYLFPGEDGFQKSMKSGLNTAKIKLGITESLSPYSFRHTFATEVLRKTANLRVVQTLLGHSNTVMTERYAHALPESLREAVETLA